MDLGVGGGWCALYLWLRDLADVWAVPPGISDRAKSGDFWFLQEPDAASRPPERATEYGDDRQSPSSNTIRFTQGFDHYYGAPESMGHSALFLDGRKVICQNPPLEKLTTLCTERLVKHIGDFKDQPFFICFVHNYPHTPYKAGPKFKGSSKDAVRGDIIQEADWGIGEILKALETNGILENTLVMFTHDKGPATGRAHPLRAKKGSTFEGPPRVPTVIRWPKAIPAGKPIDEILTAMDLLPTFAKMAGAKVPGDRVIDGKDIFPVLTEQAKSPHKAFFVYRDKDLKVVRSAKWKLHLALPAQKGATGPTKSALYELEADISETRNVLAEHPEVGERLPSRKS